MKKTTKIVALAALVSFMSGCTLTTAPQASTFWAKEQSGYQTHHDRIRTHDKRMECNKQVVDRIDWKSLTKSEIVAFSDECMISKNYEERQNWHEIKETAKN